LLAWSVVVGYAAGMRDMMLEDKLMVALCRYAFSPHIAFQLMDIFASDFGLNSIMSQIFFP
jgi:hypothetical protein